MRLDRGAFPLKPAQSSTVSYFLQQWSQLFQYLGVILIQPASFWFEQQFRHDQLGLHWALVCQHCMRARRQWLTMVTCSNSK